MKQGDLVGCSMRGGRYEGVICERGSPPLTIDEPFKGRAVGAGSNLHSGEPWGSRMMSDVHSALLFKMCRLDGRLFFLDSDDLVRISGGIGVVGGVENVSPSGDDSAKAETMTKVPVEVKERV